METNIDLPYHALQLHENKVLGNDDCFMVLDAPQPRRNLHSALPFWRYEHVNHEGLTDNECKVEFRFGKDTIYTLVHTLRLPVVIRCYKSIVIDSMEAFCICLKRYAYPCRYADLMPRFGRPVPQLCMAAKFYHRNHIQQIVLPSYRTGPALAMTTKPTNICLRSPKQW